MAEPAAPRAQPAARPIAVPELSADAIAAEAAEGPDAMTQAAYAALQRHDGASEAATLFRAALVQDPSHAPALEGLLEAATRAGSAVEHAIAASLRALVHGNGSAAPRVTIPASAAASLAPALRNPAHEQALALLARTWEAALPLFRVPLTTLGVLGTDRIAPHPSTTLGQALLAAQEVVGASDVVVFVSRRGGGVSLHRTQPPSIVIGQDAPRDELQLRFLFARAMELARPTNVIVGTSSDAEGATLFAALRAAFGPAEGTQVQRDAAALASDLWRTLPTRQQRDLRELLMEADASFEWPEVRAGVLGGAARAGLLACGDLRAAALALATVDDSLFGVDLRSPAGLAAGVAASGALTDLLRFAFGDDFVSAARPA